jgi:hypothetical protein
MLYVCCPTQASSFTFEVLRKLNRLNKNISRMNEMMTMFNKKQISLCKLKHKRTNIIRALSPSLKKTQKEKKEAGEAPQPRLTRCYKL